MNQSTNTTSPSKVFSFLEGDGDQGNGEPTMWLTKFETTSLYEAIMYMDRKGRFDTIAFGYLDVSVKELEALAFGELIKIRTEELERDPNESIFLVVGKMQDVRPELRAQGIHFHFMDVLGHTKTIAEARDMFKQGKVGDAVLMRDSKANGGWRLLTGQQIIDLHAYDEGRPLSFVGNIDDNVIAIGDLLGLDMRDVKTKARKEFKISVPEFDKKVGLAINTKSVSVYQKPDGNWYFIADNGVELMLETGGVDPRFGMHASVGEVFIPSIFVQRELILIRPMGMTPEQAEHSYELIQGAFNLVEAELEKITDPEVQKQARASIDRARNVACCRKDIVTSTLMINPSFVPPNGGCFQL